MIWRMAISMSRKVYKVGYAWGKFKRNLVERGVKYGYESGKNTSSGNKLPRPKLKRQIKK